MKFTDLIRTRRMTRAFLSQPIGDEMLRSLIDLAMRAPSAGKTQGTHYVVLTGDDVAEFWNDTLPLDKRATFRLSTHLLTLHAMPSLISKRPGWAREYMHGRRRTGRWMVRLQ